MNKYRLIKKQGEGTFSEVFKAQSIKTGAYVAIKCLKNHFANQEQVNNLKEIQALRRFSSHPNVIKLLDVLYDEPTGRLALVFELMDQNLYESIKGRKTYLPEKKVKQHMFQLLKALDFMHRSGVFHRDIKPENILLKDDQLKLADFGSCKGIYSKPPFTEYISTRWYRAPECLLTDGYYNYKMDLWGVGCVFFEILTLIPLFPGDNELDQVHRIHNVMGTPSIELLNQFKKNSSNMDFDFPIKQGSGIMKYLSHVSPECVDLISKLLYYNPEDRLSAKQALSHVYFKDLVEQDQRAVKLSIGQNLNFMKSTFMNESQSFIKSSDDTQNHININKINSNPKRNEKYTYLPEIKAHIQIEVKNRNDSEDSDGEGNKESMNKRNILTYLKLPLINKPGPVEQQKNNNGGSNFFASNEYKNQIKHNLSNQSLEIQINTQYSKVNNKNMHRKMNELKKNYISPYSPKVMNNNIKI